VEQAGGTGAKMLMQLISGCVAPSVVALKPGARVILCKNLQREMGARGVVNGTPGVVARFTDATSTGRPTAVEVDFWPVGTPATS